MGRQKAQVTWTERQPNVHGYQTQHLSAPHPRIAMPGLLNGTTTPVRTSASTTANGVSSPNQTPDVVPIPLPVAGAPLSEPQQQYEGLKNALDTFKDQQMAGVSTSASILAHSLFQLGLFTQPLTPQLQHVLVSNGLPLANFNQVKAAYMERRNHLIQQQQQLQQIQLRIRQRQQLQQ